MRANTAGSLATEDFRTANSTMLLREAGAVYAIENGSLRHAFGNVSAVSRRNAHLDAVHDTIKCPNWRSFQRKRDHLMSTMSRDHQRLWSSKRELIEDFKGRCAASTWMPLYDTGLRVERVASDYRPGTITQSSIQYTLHQTIERYPRFIYKRPVESSACVETWL